VTHSEKLYYFFVVFDIFNKPEIIKPLKTASIKFLPFRKRSSVLLPALFIGCVLASVVFSKETFFLPDDEYLQTIWTTEDGLPQNSINDILQSRDGYLWLATFGGLARFDGVKFTTFNSGNTAGLMSNRILSLCEDHNGTIWMGTQTGEIMTLNDGIGKTYATADGLPGTNIIEVLEAADGTIWAATETSLMHFESGKFIVYHHQNGFPAEQIRKIEKTDDNSLWIFTEKGLVQYKDGNFRIFNPSEGFPPESRLLVTSRKSENLWVQTANGLASFSAGKFTSYPNSGLVSETIIRTLFEDQDGTLWMLGHDINTVYKLKDGVAAVVPIKEKQASRRIMFKDREGNLWIGTDGNGLIQLKKRKLFSYSTANGLSSDFIRAVTGAGNSIWISSDVGLSHLENGKFTSYTQKDGMPNFNSTALCLGRDGTLWIGGSYAGLSGFKDGKFTAYRDANGLIAGISALFEDREGNLWIGTPDALFKMRDGKFTAFRQSDGLVNNNISFITQTGDDAMWFATVGGLSRLAGGKFTNYTIEQGLSINFIRDIFEEPSGTLWLGTYGGGLNRLKDGKITVITMQNGLFDDFISRILSDERGNLWMLSNRGIFRANAAELNDFADGRSKSCFFYRRRRYAFERRKRRKPAGRMAHIRRENVVSDDQRHRRH
jgi:ligand-binding sensor domain-containing protein